MAKVSYTTLKERAETIAAAAPAHALAGLEQVELTAEEEQRRISALIAEHEAAEAAKAADAVKSLHAERGEKWVRRVIDPHEGRLATVTGSWEPITPTLCLVDQDCSYDAAKAMGWKSGYDAIPEDLVLPWNGKTGRQAAEDLLVLHVAVKHPTTGPSHIRTPAQAREARAQRPLPEGFITNPRLS